MEIALRRAQAVGQRRDQMQKEDSGSVGIRDWSYVT